jgi:Kef-type K+ transport system membrane component KefB
VKPYLEKHFSDKAIIHPSSFSLVIICLLLFGLITSVIGIHALFGAFLAGIIMPEKNKIKEKLTHKIEMLTTVLFLPLFFVVTGLRTKVNLLNSPELIGLFVIVLLLAFGGKIIGTAIPARMTGKTWYQSWSIGVLMNTRGLMELIVLNLGYDLGVLPESLFTILTLGRYHFNSAYFSIVGFDQLLVQDEEGNYCLICHWQHKNKLSGVSTRQQKKLYLVLCSFKF